MIVIFPGHSHLLFPSFNFCILNKFRFHKPSFITGPFYVIVEYCEHGCLLNYLRRSRLEENGYINQRVRYRYRAPENKVQTDSDLKGDLLSMRDLLSFAWQIAKGMSYLSSIKVGSINSTRLSECVVL